MTTIVYDHKNGQIAVDSRVCAGGLICTDNYDKTLKNDIGFWFLCGDNCDFDYITSLSRGDKVERKINATAFVVRGYSVWEVSAGGDICTWKKLEWSDAIGSGLPYALAALDFGKTAKEAIEYAATRDSSTGGDVRYFNVSDL